MAEGINNRIQHVRNRLLVVERERNELLRQLGDLECQAYLDVPPILGASLGQATVMVVPATADDQMALLLMLLRCRESVYPLLWENKKKGTRGYAPVCDHNWAPGLCNKPRVKCSEYSHQAFRPLDETAAKDHLLAKGLAVMLGAMLAMAVLGAGLVVARSADPELFVLHDRLHDDYLTPDQCWSPYTSHAQCFTWRAAERRLHRFRVGEEGEYSDSGPVDYPVVVKRVASKAPEEGMFASPEMAIGEGTTGTARQVLLKFLVFSRP